jgi:hypothetical protein
MAIRRITLSDLVFGEPLRWDVFGPASAAPPVLQKGQLVAPGPELDGLLAAGLYAEDAAPTSVLLTLNQLNKRLERMLMEMRSEAGADAELRTIAQELINAVERAPEVALASIYLNQIAGLYAVRHCLEAAIVASLVARAMGKAPLEVLTITAAALTMNVGMVRLIEVFQCKGCVLTTEERAAVRRHPTESAELLRRVGVTDEQWIDYVLMHHENDDGSGYPEGRLGGEIPQNAKLISMADRYCAYVSARNYRRSMLPHAALAQLCLECEVPVDTGLAQHFAQQLGLRPPGTLVRLRNGEVGVVSSRPGADGALQVHVLRGPDGKLYPQPQIRRTSEPEHEIDESLHEDQAHLRFSMKQIWGELASL